MGTFGISLQRPNRRPEESDRAGTDLQYGTPASSAIGKLTIC